MKRLNPDTGEPFKHGDIREDGYVFRCYAPRIKRNGFFDEKWVSPENYQKYLNRDKVEHRNLRDVASKLLRNSRKRARLYGGSVTIDLDWIFNKLKRGKSELSNIPFQINNTNTRIYSPSIDRIDSNNRDYTPENCRLILWGENQALNSNSDETMLPILEAMVKGIKRNAKQNKLTSVPAKHTGES